MTYGWTGTILRINLSTQKVTKEDSSKYYHYLGGTGFGDRIMFEEVAPGTNPLAKENKFIMAVGPNTGTSSPCSGRTTITSLSTFTKDHMVVNSHVGGELAVQLKYAGYDAVIVEGKASSPVYININNDEVAIKPADNFWGKTTRETSVGIQEIEGKGCTVTAIGLAGENMVNLSCVINAANHSAGAGIGAIWGSKNLKAIAVYGKGAVSVYDAKEVKRLNDYVLTELIGSNNNHVVPSTERPWAEYSDPGSRWTGRPGLTWGAAEGGPVDTGDSIPGDINTIGYRCQKAYKDFGEVSEKYTVKMTGCTSCPIRCSGTVYLPELEKEGYVSAVSNTCMPNFMWTRGKILETFKDYVEEGDGKFYCNVAAMSTADDLGLWDNYGELPKTISYFIEHNLLEKILPKEEYDSLRWDLREAGDAGFIKDIMYRIATKQGVLATLGEGAYFVNERYKDLLEGKYLNDKGMSIWSPLGWSKHHGNETAAQVGALTNLFFNRDCMCHTIVNITGSGLPYDIQKGIIEEQFGVGALDKPKAYTPMNQNKARFAKFGVVRQTLHDSFTFCNWVWPMTFSPRKDRNYKGDLTVEAQYMTAITGNKVSMEDLDFAAERVLQLQRALSVLWMGTNDMRNEHDGINDWVFDADPDLKPFEEGTVKMDREDMQTAYTMMYKEMGWDETLGCPTRETLERFSLKDVADALEAKNLLP